jgi:hypothetical protein
MASSIASMLRFDMFSSRLTAIALFSSILIVRSLSGSIQQVTSD